MSYLVDALQKAERDRHRAADISSLSSTLQPWVQRTSGRRLRWLVGLLVVCNVALFGYLLLPRALGRGADAVASLPSVSAAAQTPAVAVKPSGGSAAAAPISEASTPVARPQAGARNPQQAAQRYTGPPMAPQWRGGRDTFLEANAGRRWTAPPASPVPAAGTVPEITINGHLYSATPGQSFILVGGRIYHEGERLSAGPAIVRIDASGAILGYRGRRYHVDGPG